MAKTKEYRPADFLLLGTLLAKIEYWQTKYDLSFQFWADQNNVFISRDLVEIHSMGGRDTIEEILKDTIEWCERTNPSYKYPSGIEIVNPEV